MAFGQVALKLAFSFVMLWIVTRLVGKKEISQLTPFDFISSLMLSEIVGNTLYDEEVSPYMIVLGLVFWGVLTFLFDLLTRTFKSSRNTLEGKPSLLIAKGDVNVRELHKNNLDFDQLTMMLRQKDIFSMREVEYAIYEKNGSLSVIKKAPYEAVTTKDLQLEAESECLSYCVVEDGRIREDTLRELGLSRSWLLDKLKEQGYEGRRIHDIAYAEWKETEGIYILTK
ncbi:DUF421 domain-containing protein [Paenibacillus sp. J31TS4]|uniref:DUF421 domain-containing protein n=1 Tax=Paenibacillus sp. J31TS4 TaxID=2807195 RepID=UPI001B1D9683|nr:DUF421 domain-containing protein [Paenibacillus sp. J31TS4]GIP41067.1 DUF421 domain-containing protein [Paenibacillus sp. J31TS4]